MWKLSIIRYNVIVTYIVSLAYVWWPGYPSRSWEKGGRKKPAHTASHSLHSYLVWGGDIFFFWLAHGWRSTSLLRLRSGNLCQMLAHPRALRLEMSGHLGPGRTPEGCASREDSSWEPRCLGHPRSLTAFSELSGDHSSAPNLICDPLILFTLKAYWFPQFFCTVDKSQFTSLAVIPTISNIIIKVLM